MMSQSPSPYMPQPDPNDVPALTKMINLPVTDDRAPVKSECPEAPGLVQVQADSNSNYPLAPPALPHLQNHHIPGNHIHQQQQHQGHVVHNLPGSLAGTPAGTNVQGQVRLD